MNASRKIAMPNLGMLAVKILAGIFVAFSAILFGLLAVTANPTLIALGVGLVGGTLLLMMPRVIVWLMLSIGLVAGALISFAGGFFGKLPWAISLLGMLLLVPVCLELFKHQKRQLPGYIAVAIAFLIYALFASLMHWESLVELLAGFKRYFQSYGLLLGLALLPFDKKDHQRWLYLLLGIAFLQLPFALYELLFLVSKRGGLDAGSVATDVVAGTFGANIEGGSPNSVMVIFLLIAFAFVFARWRGGLITGNRFVWMSLLLLLPVGMGETKVAMLMFPLVWLVIIRRDLIAAPLRYLPSLVAGGLLTALIGYVYVELIMKSTFTEVIAGAFSYNFGEAGYAHYYLNRTTVLSFWLQQQGMSDPLSFFFGNGLGSSYLGEISGHIAMQYPYYGINLTAASTILWDLGIFGLLLFIGIFMGAWRAANRLYRESDDPVVRADAIAIQAAIALFLLFVLYSQTIVNLIGMEIIYAAVLGYLSYLYRTHILRREPLEKAIKP